MLAISSALAASASAEVVLGGSGVLGVNPVDHTNPPAGVGTASCVDVHGAPLPPASLCFHWGTVLPANGSSKTKTYALYWDPYRAYPAASKFALDTFFADVAHDSGLLGNPFADSPQYLGTNGRAAYAQAFYGAVTDYGGYPAGCPVPPGQTSSIPSQAHYVACVNDANVQAEIQRMIAVNALPHDGSQLFTLFTPPTVAVCSNAVGAQCSLTDPACSPGAGPACLQSAFCGYHSYMPAGGVLIPYAVQPWTAGTACDEPASYFPPGTEPALRLVSPLSEALLGAVTDPFFGGWFSRTGAEIGDGPSPADAATIFNPQQPGGGGPCGYQPQSPAPGDVVSINGRGYVLQGESSNAGVQVRDPGSPFCVNGVKFQAQFTVPAQVNPDDVVFLDGSGSLSTLAGFGSTYAWTFGDNTSGSGPSVSHAYSTPGPRTITLTVTDEAGNLSTFSQTITVLGSVPGSPGTQRPVITNPGGIEANPAAALSIRLRPSSLRKLVRSGLLVDISTDRKLSAFVDLLIPRGTARRAHIRAGKAKFVLVGTGVIATIPRGQSKFRVRLNRRIARRLAKLGHVRITLRLSVIDPQGRKGVADAARRY